jgi:hypothetical protein
VRFGLTCDDGDVATSEHAAAKRVVRAKHAALHGCYSCVMALAGVPVRPRAPSKCSLPAKGDVRLGGYAQNRNIWSANRWPWCVTWITKR